MGFFVTKNGVALTAAHVVPDPANLRGKRFFAIVWDGKKPRAHDVVAAMEPEGRDISVLKISAASPNFLPISFQRVHMGEDVMAIGIPNASTWAEDRDFRLFKGHVTRAKRFIETSFPAPRGLSGSPVLRRGSVVGVVSGNHRSEALEDQVEYVDVSANGHKTTTRVETKAVVNFGLVEPLSEIAEFTHDQFGGRTFEKFIQDLC